MTHPRITPIKILVFNYLRRENNRFSAAFIKTAVSEFLLINHNQNLAFWLQANDKLMSTMFFDLKTSTISFVWVLFCAAHIMKYPSLLTTMEFNLSLSRFDRAALDWNVLVASLCIFLSDSFSVDKFSSSIVLSINHTMLIVSDSIGTYFFVTFSKKNWFFSESSSLFFVSSFKIR